LIVPRFRQSAVLRNRLKRRLRELSRLRLLTTTDIAADVVIRIRPDAYRASFATLALEMDQLIKQLVRWNAATRIPSGSVQKTTPDMHQGDT
jgi:ribonuclease P protein component